MTLKGKTVGILVEKDYQDLEVWFPALRLQEEGAEVLFIGTGSAAEYKGKYGYPAAVDVTADKLNADSLDALIVPGGWAPDFLRRYESVLKLVRGVFKKGKIVASICHGGWVLASANVLKGKTATSFSAIRDDVSNAGARWVDKETVVDGNLITARKPEDLPAFCKAIIASLEK
ncbi:MAG TPA: type 1 glutamine amidotransferase domain-containing protein [Elusimicrobiota bacterium]|nr:type 1 glutamine amidotransferase domain-containing protein [Elusimicrobiota bacterium]